MSIELVIYLISVACSFCAMLVFMFVLEPKAYSAMELAYMVGIVLFPVLNNAVTLVAIVHGLEIWVKSLPSFDTRKKKFVERNKQEEPQELR